MKNIERYKTVRDQKRAHRDFCESIALRDGSCGRAGEKDCAACAISWLQDEVDESANWAECPFCGSKVSVGTLRDVITMKGFFVKCGCGYRTRTFTIRETAIEEHNLVGRVVKSARMALNESKEKEG